MTTKTLIAGPKLKTAIPGPNAKRILAGDEKYISPSYTRSYPMVAKRGRGIVVEDVDGNEFFDFSAGHCRDLDRPLPSGSGCRHSEAGGRTDPHVGHRLLLRGHGDAGRAAIEDCADAGAAQDLLRKLRSRSHRVRFEAGALSHQAAAHYRVPGRVPRTDHGRALADRLEAAAEAPLLRRWCPGLRTCAIPMCIGAARAVRRMPRNSRSAARATSKTNCLRPSSPPEEVAAIFVEPIQGEGGYVVAPTIFMQELRRICDKYGILLVVDEVQSGIGRTGKWFAVEHSGVHPDIVCMAKGIASGMPLGVTMSRADVMDWVPGSHASTFGGNPVCIAAALATLDVIEKEGLVQEFAGGWRPHAEAHGGLAEEAQDCRRRSRARPDDRSRDREGPDDSRARQQRARSHRRSRRSSAASCF